MKHLSLFGLFIGLAWRPRWWHVLWKRQFLCWREVIRDGRPGTFRVGWRRRSLFVALTVTVGPFGFSLVRA